jgi:hypothetical protein
LPRTQSERVLRIIVLTSLHTYANVFSEMALDSLPEHRKCNQCNQTKVQHQRPIGELHPSETLEAPWEVISVDFIVELLESHGYDAIMCVIDSLTKCAHFIPTHTTINAKGTALLFLKEVWKHHGTPQVVVSDRGPQFVAGFTRELYKLLGIKLALLMAYHPQTDSQMECVNQVLEGYLHTFTSQQQDDWDDFLPTGEFHFNNSKHSLTQQTPFMVDTGRHPPWALNPSNHALPWSWPMNSWNT